MLRRLSGQLDHLAAEVFRIEHALGDGLAVSELRDMATVHRLQRLDYVRQSLEDAALLSLFLSDGQGSMDAGSIADRLRLEETRQLLAPTTKYNTAQMQMPAAVGEVDLF
ncbi:hypothetical protein Z945_2087 [Sulfitobacter noctilucae]|nr:hypothetical protein Z945_2087 [Sulfitobacter noctilucae]